jgi:hypothetical protein
MENKKKAVLFYEKDSSNHYELRRLKNNLFSKLFYLRKHKDNSSKERKEYIEKHCNIDILCEYVDKIMEIEKNIIIGSVFLDINN